MTDTRIVANSTTRQQKGSRKAAEIGLRQESKSANICVKVTPSERSYFLERAKAKRRSMASVMYEALVAVYGHPDDA